MLKDFIRKHINKYIMTESLRSLSISPNSKDSNTLASSILNSYISDIKNIPTISSSSYLSSSVINSFFNYPKALLDGISESAKNSVIGYRDVISEYRKINSKIKYLFDIYKNDIDLLTNKPCFTFFTNIFNLNQNNSMCSVVGSYAVLPYIIPSAKTYTGPIAMSASSSAQIYSNNLSSIINLPLENTPVLEFYSSSVNIKTNITLLLSSSSDINAFYIKMSNSVKRIIITVGNIVTSIDDNEAFLSFDKQTGVNKVSINVEVFNTNIGKPIPLLIHDIIIYSNIVFTPRGYFQTIPLAAETIKNAQYISINSTNISDKTLTDYVQGVSFGLDDAVGNIFTQVENNQSINFSSGTLQHSYTDNTPPIIINYLNQKFKTYRLPEEMLDIDILNSHMFYGLNQSFLSDTANSKDNFLGENWVKEGNIYGTNIFNYSDDVILNLGNIEIEINGVKYTGTATIPKGISQIKIHSAYFNVSVDPYNQNSVESDKLYPFNAMFILEGLPLYSGGNPKIIRKNFVVDKNIAVLSVGQAILPTPVSVVDTAGREYTLHLNEGIGDKGTYNLDQKTGTFYVRLFDTSNELIISYYPSSPIRPSCGITFASLLTHKDIKILATDTSTPSFSIINQSDGKYIYINAINGYEFVNTKQMVYSNISDKMMCAARIDMYTKNKYITPAIKNIYMSVK